MFLRMCLACFGALGFGVAWATPQEPTPVVAMAIKGGISLGAYEAGLAWAIVDYYRTQRSQSNDGLAAVGTSAGGINALLAAITWCSSESERGTVEENLIQQTWYEIGAEGLLPSPDASRRDGEGLLSRAAFRPVLDRILERLLSKSFQPGCWAELGLTVTRFTPVVGKNGLPRQSERIWLKLEVGEDGGVTFRNAHHRAEKEPVLALFENEKGFVDPRLVLNAVLASSAFPWAFTPVPLQTKRLQNQRSDDWDGRFCWPAYRLAGHWYPMSAVTARVSNCAGFVDGGVFNNLPLDMLFYYSASVAYVLDPTLPSRPSVSIGSARSVLSWLGFLGNTVDTATLSAKPVAPLHGATVLKRNHRLFADQIAHFGAFLHPHMRTVDYQIGVFDGYSLVGVEDPIAHILGVATKPSSWRPLQAFVEGRSGQGGTLIEGLFSILAGPEVSAAELMAKLRPLFRSGAACSEQCSQGDAKSDALARSCSRSCERARQLGLNSLLRQALAAGDSWWAPYLARLMKRGEKIESEEGNTKGEERIRTARWAVRRFMMKQSDGLNSTATQGWQYFPTVIGLDTLRGEARLSYEWRNGPLRGGVGVQYNNPFLGGGLHASGLWFPLGGTFYLQARAQAGLFFKGPSPITDDDVRYGQFRLDLLPGFGMEFGGGTVRVGATVGFFAYTRALESAPDEVCKDDFYSSSWNLFTDQFSPDRLLLGLELSLVDLGSVFEHL